MTNFYNIMYGNKNNKIKNAKKDHDLNISNLYSEIENNKKMIQTLFNMVKSMDKKNHLKIASIKNSLLKNELNLKNNVERLNNIINKKTII